MAVESTIEPELSIVYDGHRIYLQVTENGVTVQERIPRHLKMLPAEQCEVLLAPYARKLRRKLSAAKNSPATSAVRAAN